MKAGDLTTRVTILKPVRGTSDYGLDKRLNYEPVLYTKARKRFRGGNMNVSANETFYHATVVFSFYLTVGRFIKDGYLIDDGSLRYRIVSIENNQKYRCLVVTTENINE